MFHNETRHFIVNPKMTIGEENHHIIQDLVLA